MHPLHSCFDFNLVVLYHRYWVRLEDVFDLKLKIIEHLPLLLFGESPEVGFSTTMHTFFSFCLGLVTCEVAHTVVIRIVCVLLVSRVTTEACEEKRFGQRAGD